MKDSEKHRIIFYTMADAFQGIMEEFMEQREECLKCKGRDEHDFNIGILHGYYSILYRIALELECHDEVFGTKFIEEMSLIGSQEIEKLYMSA